MQMIKPTQIEETMVSTQTIEQLEKIGFFEEWDREIPVSLAVVIKWLYEACNLFIEVRYDTTDKYETFKFYPVIRYIGKYGNPNARQEDGEHNFTCLRYLTPEIAWEIAVQYCLTKILPKCKQG